MEWLVGIYLAVGVLKALGRLGERNPSLKPIWMSTERNPLKFCLYFTAYSLIWPFARK